MSRSDADFAPSPHSYGSEPWRTVFNRRSFHQLNVSDPHRIVSLAVADDGGAPIGGLTAVRDGDALVSGYSAPFGGVDFVKEHETPSRIARVVQEVVTLAQGTGAHRLVIKLPPASYDRNQGALTFTLLNHGFAVTRCEFNQTLDLRGLASASEWAHRLHRPAARALRALRSMDFRLQVCTTPAQVRRGYELLAQNRARKGRRMSISADYVLKAWNALPDLVAMSELSIDGEPVAAALTYDITAKQRLVVSWGDADCELPRSPMLLLAFCAIEAAISDGVEVLDLGTSNVPTVEPSATLEPDLGLAQFKRSVLAQAEPRLTVSRSLRETR